MLYRIPLYMSLGLVTEVLFTGFVDLAAPRFLESWRVKNPDPRNRAAPSRSDPRAVGYTFLWMIPCYALLVFLEPLTAWLSAWPLWLRGFVYLPLFWMGEYTTGFLIKKISGYCPWDYSYSKYSLHGYIRWDFGPLWYAFTLIVDIFSRKFILLTPAIKAVLNLA
ncbi:MAG: hypothetical protein Q7T11_00065 [Deltaproteobacteria bacterium]|nr:hypothetical protein [Deltaproteobacteria bacterium]